jgi:hypothetical protein
MVTNRSGNLVGAEWEGKVLLRPHPFLQLYGQIFNDDVTVFLLRGHFVHA